MNCGETVPEEANFRLELCGDRCDDVIRFFFELGDVVRQNVENRSIGNLQSRELSEVHHLSFGRLCVRGLRLIGVTDGEAPSKGFRTRCCTWSGDSG